MIQAYLGEALDPEPARRADRCAGIHYFMPEGLNRFTRIRGLERLYGLDGFLDFQMEVNPNCEIPDHHDFRRYVAHAVFVGRTRSEVKASMDNAAHIVSFE